MRKRLRKLPKRFLPLLAVGALVWCFGARSTPAYGGVAVGFVQLEFDTELTSLNLSGGPFLMPLAADPGNVLFPGTGEDPSVEGYGFVNSEVLISLSSQRLVSPGPASTGHAWAFSEGRADSAVIL